MTKVRKICTLWTHDDNFCREDIVFNAEKFAELPTTPGTLLQIVALPSGTSERDFHTNPRTSVLDSPQVKGGDHAGNSNVSNQAKRGRRDSITVTIDENGSTIPGNRHIDMEKAYVFSVATISADLKTKHANLQVSIAERVAKVFGFRNRMQVIVTEADEEKHEAHHVELVFRDEYLARADMWRMAVAELSKRTVFRGQRLLFMGTIKATIKHIYVNGRSMHSGYFSTRTKPIFRSESARYVLFIQMSKEMWDFDTEGAGEIMFNKVVNGFLPDLFKRWLKINARHLVTIILFTRMQYNAEVSFGSRDDDDRTEEFRDYYRVVISDMASGDWINILYQLKKEFRTFLREVSLVTRISTQSLPTDGRGGEDGSASGSNVAGRPSPASQGNILEAINLAAAQFAKDYIDRDLVRTGISVIVVTPGTGAFEVDYNMLKLTTDTLMGSGIGIDLVCLSPMPLHSVPLFKYRPPRLISALKPGNATANNERRNSHKSFPGEYDRTPRQYEPKFRSENDAPAMVTAESMGDNPIVLPLESVEDWRFAMPYWVDVSFWSGDSDEIVELTKPRSTNRIDKRSQKKGRGFSLRCRLYELQMMGVMDDELGDISIPYLREDAPYPTSIAETSESSKEYAQNKSLALHARSTAPGSYSSRGEKDYGKEQLDEGRVLQKNWMEAYDDNVFSSSNNASLVSEPREASDAKRLELAGSYRDRYLSASVGSSTASFGNKQKAASFHQLMRKQSREEQKTSPRDELHQTTRKETHPMPRADVLQRQKALARITDNRINESRDSSAYARTSSRSMSTQATAYSRESSPASRKGTSTTTAKAVIPTRAETKPRPPKWILRQISFGGKGAISQPTVADATIDISHGKVKPAMLTVEKNQKGAIAERLASSRLTIAEKPSQPIAIRASSRADLPSSGSPSFDKTGRSVETIKGPNKSTANSVSESTTKDPGSTFLLAGSRALGEPVLPKPTLSLSVGVKDLPGTLSPTSAIAPWAVLVNPCNPKKNMINPRNQFRRWHHVFPRTLRTGTVKWRSLCSPAAVPLTHDWFPTAEQIATEYNESPYKITQNEDDDVLEAPKSRESLIRELIAFRLSHGFQVVVGSSVAEFSGLEEKALASILAPEYMSADGDTVFMSVGNNIHQLVCVAGGEVEVKRFNRKPTTALESSAGIDAPFPYKAYIKTAFEDTYDIRDLLLHPPRKEYNWNFIDTFLAGYHDEFSDVLQFWRARFVLIPIEIPMMNRRPLPMLAEDSEEEIRLEGIRKLTQLWQRYRHIPAEERTFQSAASRKQKDPNPLAIEYHTRDPSAIVAAGPEFALLHEADSELQTSLFSDSEQYQSSNIDLKKLAEDLQSEKGIQMIDRRWHWKLHHTCFLGFDLVNWLLSNFTDLETRDEAVELGNELMNKGLFIHVQKRHQFRDGNFFFQIAAEYRAPRPESRMGWFGMRKSDKSVPSTPMGEGPRISPLIAKSNSSGKSRPSTADSSGTSDSDPENEKTPWRPGPKRKVTLSRVMRYDVDNRKRSYRPEIISLHYDRLHNPDNCYHIRIDWMNVTAKLIEDAIVTWATSVEKYGLKLVEVPTCEITSIVDRHPFRSPYLVKLALQPPQAPHEAIWDSTHMPSQYIKADPFIYHKALLRKLHFVLDIEAASSFPSDVEVSYSWGANDYKYTQFIHRSGTVLAQITDDGNFQVLANRLAHNRTKDSSRMRVTDPYEHKKATTDGTQSSRLPSTPAVERANPHRSPFSSPLARPVQDSNLLHTTLQDFNRQSASASPLAKAAEQTPEQIKDELEAFCSDAHLLSVFYREAFKQAPSPSPRIMPVLDNNIPSLGLPPAISIREASPANSGWTLSSTFVSRNGNGVPSDSGIAGRRQGSDGSMSTLGRRASIVEASASGGLQNKESHESLGDGGSVR